MHDRIDAAHRWRERLGPADVPPVDLHTPLSQPGRILVGKHEHAHTVATLLQRLHKVAAEQPVSTRDQDVHTAPPSCLTGDQCRRRCAMSAMTGSTCSSQAIA